MKQKYCEGESALEMTHQQKTIYHVMYMHDRDIQPPKIRGSMVYPCICRPSNVLILLSLKELPSSSSSWRPALPPTSTPEKLNKKSGSGDRQSLAACSEPLCPFLLHTTFCYQLWVYEFEADKGHQISQAESWLANQEESSPKGTSQHILLTTCLSCWLSVEVTEKMIKKH